MANWSFQPIASPMLLAVIAAILIALLFLGPAFGKISGSRRWTLSLVRLGIVLMALLATLRPGCVQQIERSQSATLLFIADTSRSMELPHRADDSTRYGAMKQMLQDSKAQIAELIDGDIAVKFFGFDGQLYDLDFVDGQVVLPEKPTGSETDIASSLFKSAIDSRQERLIGVMIASDGVPNVLDPQIELSQAAEILDDLSVPLFAIPFGLPGDTGQVADVAVLSLPEQHRIAVKNQLNVEATISARGYANQPVRIDLYVTDAAGQEQQVDSVRYVPDKSYVEKKVLLRHTPLEAGQYRMRVHAVAESGNELALRNNDLPSFLNVYEGGLRVLYLDGGFGWTQSFVRDAIASSAQDVELIVLPIPSDEKSRKQWPLGGLVTDWFKDPTIDVYIIGDVDSRALHHPARQTQNLELLEQAIDRGKGLIMLGGAHSFGPGRYHSTPLDDILPIQMNLDEQQDFPPAKLRRDLHINEPVKLIPTGEHFLTRIGSEVDFRTAWESLPPLVGANRFVDVKDNAQILLKSENGNPILVAGRLGGRVLAFAGDSTYRWVMHDHENEFKKFWRQILLWLADQDGREKNSVWIDLPQRRFPPSSYISFQCRASDTEGSLITGAQFNANLVKPDGTSSTIAIDGGSQKGEIFEDALQQPGVYQIKLTGTHRGKELGDSLFEFVVFDRDREKAISSADPDQMARLAAQTAAHGGKVVLPEQFGQQLQYLKDNPPETIEVPLKRQLGQDFTDAAVFLVLFVLLLGIEWILRKNWGLV